MKVILFNPEVTAGTTMHSLCGRSGKVYGKTRNSNTLGGHIFEMSLDEYAKAARDILSNKLPLQFWIPIFVPDPEPANDQITYEPTEASEMLSQLLYILGGHAIDADQSPIETLTRVLSGRAVPTAEVPDDNKATRQAELTQMDIKEVRALAQEKSIETKGMTKRQIILKLIE